MEHEPLFSQPRRPHRRHVTATATLIEYSACASFLPHPLRQYIYILLKLIMRWRRRPRTADDASITHMWSRCSTTCCVIVIKDSRLKKPGSSQSGFVRRIIVFVRSLLGRCLVWSKTNTDTHTHTLYVSMMFVQQYIGYVVGILMKWFLTNRSPRTSSAFAMK